MKTRILLGLCILLISGISMAQVPSTINFQGVLTDSNDDPIEGVFDMTFRIYDADVDGNMVWEELQSSVQVTKGLFNVMLGSVEPISIEFNSAYFLSVQKGNESELSPRITLTSVPSSINSENTSKLSGGTNFIPSSGSAGFGTSNPLASVHVEESGPDDPMRVRVNSLTKLIVKNDGKVGVSTTDPTETLDVNGKIRIRGGVPGAGKVLTSNASGVATWEASSAGIAEINSSGGNIGIGTTTQKVKLSVNGKTYIKGDGDQGTGDTYTPTIDLAIDDSDTGFEVPSDGVLTMFTNNIERVRLNSAGQMGVGTTNSQGAKLFVEAASTEDALRVRIAQSTKLKVASNGNVAVGSNITPSYQLQVSGNVAGTSFVNTSDKRWKKNIKSFENGLDKVLALRGVTYDWRIKEFSNKGFVKGGQIGFIAQEVEEILPDLVSTDKEGYKSVKYANITAVLVEAIKEQQKIIESLQNELDESKEVQAQFSAELTALKAMVIKEIRKQNKKSFTASN